MSINKTKLEQWIDESIAITQTRIDEAQAKDYQEMRLRYEGYLECLLQLQNLMDTR